jgi:hypothetical protein
MLDRHDGVYDRHLVRNRLGMSGVYHDGRRVFLRRKP